MLIGLLQVHQDKNHGFDLGLNFPQLMKSLRRAIYYRTEDFTFILNCTICMQASVLREHSQGRLMRCLGVGVACNYRQQWQPQDMSYNAGLWGWKGNALFVAELRANLRHLNCTFLIVWYIFEWFLSVWRNGTAEFSVLSVGSELGNADGIAPNVSTQAQAMLRLRWFRLCWLGMVRVGMVRVAGFGRDILCLRVQTGIPFAFVERSKQASGLSHQ